MAGPPLLKIEGITKRYPAVLANDAISFSVAPGEIHALLGENGAGKSTLVKIIYGVTQPDAGTMQLAGEPYAPANPSDARNRGVGMVFQHFSLFDSLTVAENVALGLPAAKAEGDLVRRIREVGGSYGLAIDPERHVADLSVGERQRVEIVRCLLQDPRLIILDEPTSVLTPQEAEGLFATLRRLAGEGRSVLYISHKLEEIRSLCDHATVLRGGRVVATAVPREETAKSLAEMMIGETLRRPVRTPAAGGAVRLNVDGLNSAAAGVALDAISFDLVAGEILGIAGVAGNGQVELIDVLAGERTVAADAIRLDGRPIGHLGPEQRRRLGLGVVPEERLGHAAVPDLSLAENALLTAASNKRLVRRGVIDHAAAAAFAGDVVRAFDVRTAGVEHAASSLSGGNLQKYIVGREVLQSPAVLCISQPTWGVDAGATALIHKSLLDLASSGAALLVISQDLDELMEIATRIAVISHGRLTAPRPVGQMTVEEIGLAMGGRAMPREPADADA